MRVCGLSVSVCGLSIIYPVSLSVSLGLFVVTWYSSHSQIALLFGRLVDFIAHSGQSDFAITVHGRHRNAARKRHARCIVAVNDLSYSAQEAVRLACSVSRPDRVCMTTTTAFDMLTADDTTQQTCHGRPRDPRRSRPCHTHTAVQDNRHRST